MDYPTPKQWETLGWVPLLAGLFWLLAGSGAGWWLWAVLPGSLLLASGISLLLMPGDARITGMTALGAVLGMICAWPAWWAGGFGIALIAGLLSFASFLSAGRIAIRRAPLYLGATPPEMSTSMDLKVAIDEAVLGYFVFGARIPSGSAATRTCEDSLRMEAAIQAQGYDREPERLHVAPPAPEETYVDRARLRKQDYEILRFDSAYSPPTDFPNAATWRGLANNGECHVRILRHPGKPRPWLMCVHGYRMGTAMLDLSLFSPGWLHHKLGLNIIQPVLPLHGPRRAGARSGDMFLDGDLSDLLYAEAQALWDLRRTLAWLRASEPEARVGVFGISLGGYNAALLATYDDQLDFVVAGIPVIDLAAVLWNAAPPPHRQFFAQQGLDEARYRGILQPVSPLSRPPLLPRERLFIVAANADRIVVPAHPLLLAQHWQVPVQWYQGSHLSVRREHEVRDVLKQAISRAGWPLE